MDINSDLIFSFFHNNLKELLGNSFQGNYLFRYLDDLGAKTCVLEPKYIDKDYMIDYQKFYSRAFEDIERTTKRVHFFTEDFSPTKFKKLLKDGNTKYLGDYLGFVVVKPISDSNGNSLLGRTLLKPPSSEEGDFVSEKDSASLFGIPLKIESLPFQVQDRGVSACATIALWTAIYPLADTFGTPRHSPAEITEISTSVPAPHRKFPSRGLTLEQVTMYVGSIGLDIEVIKVDESLIPLAVKAYIKEAKLPLIAFLKLVKNNKEDYHVAVISGYQCDSEGNLKELYVHDDQIGPYSRVKPVSGNFKFWENEWCTEYEYDTVEVENLFIPIYPKVRLTFPRIYGCYIDMIGKFNPDLDWELYLTTVEKYKERLLNKSMEDKIKALTLYLPRFIWVIRAGYKNQPWWDDLYDGTSVKPRRIDTIYY